MVGQSFFLRWGDGIGYTYSILNSFYRFRVVLFDLCINFAIEKNEIFTNKQKH